MEESSSSLEESPSPVGWYTPPGYSVHMVKNRNFCLKKNFCAYLGYSLHFRLLSSQSKTQLFKLKCDQTPFVGVTTPLQIVF